jgi:hypothetical protein
VVNATPIPMLTPEQASKFWSRVDASGDCWEWTGSKLPTGYGRFSLRKSHAPYAHRVVWHVLIGPLDPDTEIDHRCFNTSCVNPDHLEPVTRIENLRRARWSGGKMRAARTHCPKGHPYDEENTSWTRDRRRQCKACGRLKAKVKWLRKKGDRPGRGEWRREITHCPQGHPYSEENTHFYPPGKGGRQCKTCNRARSAAHYQAKKAAKLAAEPPQTSTPLENRAR